MNSIVYDADKNNVLFVILKIVERDGKSSFRNRLKFVMDTDDRSYDLIKSSPLLFIPHEKFLNI